MPIYPSIRKHIISAHVVAAAIVHFFILYYMIFEPRAESLIYISSIFIVVLFGWSIWSWFALTGSLFNFYILFLLATVLFNGGQALLEVFQLNRDGILGGRFSSETVLAALFLVVLSLVWLHLGALAVSSPRIRAPKEIEVTTQNQRRSEHSCRIVGWTLLAISIVPVIFILKDLVEIAISSGYFATYQREAVTGFGAAPRVLANFLVPAALFLLAGSKKRPSGIIVSTVVIIIYVAIMFFIGSRTWAGMALIAFAWLWHRRIRPLPNTFLLGSGAVLLFVVFPFVKFIRNISGQERFALTMLFTSFFTSENPVIAIISEMGASITTIAYTTVLVPSVRGFDFGISYLYALLTLVPNLFWDIHPTISHGQLGHWLLSMVSPFRTAGGGGLGYSFIAEAYLNFGWFGLPVVMFLIGFMVVKFIRWGEETNDPAKMAALAAAMSFFLFFARSESAGVVRFLVWYSLIPYLGVKILGIFSRSTFIYGKNRLTGDT